MPCFFLSEGPTEDMCECTNASHCLFWSPDRQLPVYSYNLKRCLEPLNRINTIGGQAVLARSSSPLLPSLNLAAEGAQVSYSVFLICFNVSFSHFTKYIRRGCVLFLT